MSFWTTVVREHLLCLDLEQCPYMGVYGHYYSAGGGFGAILDGQS